MLVVNDPSRLIILLPSGLKDGEYTLTVTTQFVAGKTLLKSPRQASQIIYIGEAPAGGCVQAGWTPKKGEPRVLPIYQSTTFKYDTSEQMARLFDLEDSGYFYTRLQNPTNDAVAAKIAALEGGAVSLRV